jgi:CDP-glucose 4,6-dehydratase
MYEGSYNFGPDESDYVTTSTLVEMFFTEWGTSRQWGSDFQNGMHEAGILKLDCSKAKSVLGWKPRYSVDHSVKKTVEWYRTLYDNQNCRDLTMNQINEYLSL